MSELIPYRRELPTGEVVEVMMLTFGRGRVTIGDGCTFVRDSC